MIARPRRPLAALLRHTRLGRAAVRALRAVASRRSSGPWTTIAPAAPARPAEPSADERYRSACAAAREALDAGQANLAAGLARQALDALPRGLDATRLLGLALLEWTDARPARHAFEAALALDPLDVAAAAGIAEAVELLEDTGASEAAWRHAWELEPASREIGQRLQEARRSGGALDDVSGSPPLTRAALARIQLRGGLFEHAAIEARSALTKEPDRLDLQLTLAEACWRAGEPAAAGAVAAQILERSPDCVAANLLLAVQLLSEGEDASGVLERIQAVDPEGSVAARLFDDREVPVLFGPDQALATAPAPPAPPVTPAPMPQPAAEPEPPSTDQAAEHLAVEPATTAGPSAVPSSAEREAQEPAPEPAQDTYSEFARPNGASDLEQRAAMVAATEDSALADTVPLPAVSAPTTEIPSPVSVTDHVGSNDAEATADPADAIDAIQASGPANIADAKSADELPTPTPQAVAAVQDELVEAEQPVPAAANAAGGSGRAAGDEAMRVGHYFAAMRAYGAWLRTLRAERSNQNAGR